MDSESAGHAPTRAGEGQGQSAQAVLELGGEQTVISAEEYAEFEQLRMKMDAMKVAFAS